MAREFRMSEGLKLIWKQASIISKNRGGRRGNWSIAQQ